MSCKHSSHDLSEEKQIQGRTARQGKDGTYCMILLAQELIDLGADPKITHLKQPEVLYNELKALMQTRCLSTSEKKNA